MSRSRLVHLACSSSVALGVVACGPPESEFIPEYNRLWCQHRMECEDEALRVFDGLTSQQVCEDRSILDLADWGDGCVYVSTTATECLADMATLTCPAEEGRLATQPVTCTNVYVDCTDAGDTQDSGDAPQDSGDAPADTDPPADTDAQ